MDGMTPARAGTTWDSDGDHVVNVDDPRSRGDDQIQRRSSLFPFG